MTTGNDPTPNCSLLVSGILINYQNNMYLIPKSYLPQLQIGDECASIIAGYFENNEPIKAIYTTITDPYGTCQTPTLPPPSTGSVTPISIGCVVTDSQNIYFLPDSVLELCLVNNPNDSQINQSFWSTPWLKSVYATVNVCPSGQDACSVEQSCLPESVATCAALFARNPQIV